MKAKPRKRLLDVGTLLAKAFEDVSRATGVFPNSASQLPTFGRDALAAVAKALLEPLGELARLNFPSPAKAINSWVATRTEESERIRKLIGCGWYPEGRMNPRDPNGPLALAAAGRRTALNRQMMDFLNCELPRMKKSLYARHPNRAKVLRQAFRAHGERRYALSIPVFLAQADGICFDVSSSLFFSKKRARVYRDAITRGRYALPPGGYGLEAFDDTPPLAKGYDTRNARKKSQEFNRNGVLHGHDLSYGTRVNSFKAISLLSYLSWVGAVKLGDRGEYEPPFDD